jgi:hypothetical protein
VAWAAASQHGEVLTLNILIGLLAEALEATTLSTSDLFPALPVAVGVRHRQSNPLASGTRRCKSLTSVATSLTTEFVNSIYFGPRRAGSNIHVYHRHGLADRPLQRLRWRTLGACPAAGIFPAFLAASRLLGRQVVRADGLG